MANADTSTARLTANVQGTGAEASTGAGVATDTSRATGDCKRTLADVGEETVDGENTEAYPATASENATPFSGLTAAVVGTGLTSPRKRKSLAAGLDSDADALIGAGWAVSPCWGTRTEESNAAAGEATGLNFGAKAVVAFTGAGGCSEDSYWGTTNACEQNAEGSHLSMINPLSPSPYYVCNSKESNGIKYYQLQSGKRRSWISDENPSDAFLEQINLFNSKQTSGSLVPLSPPTIAAVPIASSSHFESEDNFSAQKPDEKDESDGGGTTSEEKSKVTTAEAIQQPLKGRLRSVRVSKLPAAKRRAITINDSPDEQPDKKKSKSGKKKSIDNTKHFSRGSQKGFLFHFYQL
jgi:hypothetical protein